MTYKVTKQYGSNREGDVGQFKDITSARQFAHAKISEDVMLKVKAIYRIYEWDDLLEQINSEDVAQTTKEEGTQSQGQGQGARFSPTPLASAPRPPGAQQNWVPEDKDEGKK